MWLILLHDTGLYVYTEHLLNRHKMVFASYKLYLLSYNFQDFHLTSKTSINFPLVSKYLYTDFRL